MKPLKGRYILFARVRLRDEPHTGLRTSLRSKAGIGSTRLQGLSRSNDGIGSGFAGLVAFEGRVGSLRLRASWLFEGRGGLTGLRGSSLEDRMGSLRLRASWYSKVGKGSPCLRRSSRSKTGEGSRVCGGRRSNVGTLTGRWHASERNYPAGRIRAERSVM